MTPISHSQDATTAEVLEVDFRQIGKRNKLWNFGGVAREEREQSFTGTRMYEALISGSNLDEGKETLEIAQEYLSCDSNELRIFDYGCGTGISIQQMARSAGEKLDVAMGYDPYPLAHKLRKNIEDGKSPNSASYQKLVSMPAEVKQKVNFTKEATDLLKQEPFNLGICWGVGMWWSKEGQLLSELATLAAILQRGGILNLCMGTMLTEMPEFMVDRDVKYISKAEMLSSIGKVGFEVLNHEISPTGEDLEHHDLILRKTRNVQFRQRGA